MYSKGWEGELKLARMGLDAEMPKIPKSAVGIASWRSRRARSIATN